MDKTQINSRLTAEQAKNIASKVDLSEYIVDCILRRIEMLAKKGAVYFDFTLKAGQEHDANDALYLKMGFNDDFEYLTRIFLDTINDFDTSVKVKRRLQDLGYEVSRGAWSTDLESFYRCGVIYFRISW